MQKIVFPNETKHFRFTQEQYILLEMEYNRYSVYKEWVKSIENIFKLHTKYKKTDRKNSNR